MVELLFWPAVLGYGEAAVALVGEARHPGRAGRLAIWGVRVGWLAQTGLLAAQAADANGFPWSSWAGALNLLSWLVVGAFLIWGCSPPYRLLGLGVMPLAALLLGAAYVGGGIGEHGDHPGIVLGLHVALMLAAFAGLTLAAGLAAFYLWHERRLKRREVRILRLRVPPLDTLDRLSARTAAISLGVLSAGIALGLAGLAQEDGARFDRTMAMTLAVWGIFVAVLGLRFLGELRGRRAARVLLGAFVLAVVVLPLTHFA
jgi:ABC-type uncharacterized transport system permease subunit